MSSLQDRFSAGDELKLSQYSRVGSQYLEAFGSPQTSPRYDNFSRSAGSPASPFQFDLAKRVEAHEAVKKQMARVDFLSDGLVGRGDLKDFLDRQCRGAQGWAQDVEEEAVMAGLEHKKEENVRMEEKLNKIKFNDHIFRILFDKLKPLEDGRVYIEDFVHVYMEGELKILERSKQTIQILSQRMWKKDGVQKELAHIKKMKQSNTMQSLNRFGIQDDSVLKVDVNRIVFSKSANLPTIGSITDRISQNG